MKGEDIQVLGMYLVLYFFITYLLGTILERSYLDLGLIAIVYGTHLRCSDL